jgi:oxygen-independent coproporphyrinogen-3 oxidase
MDAFVDRLLREADLWLNAPSKLKPRTVFFGGGTPSLLPADAMLRLITGLRKRFDFSECSEWTVEANPATISAEYCQILAANRVNRISMGAQSFDRSELALLERHHDPADVGAGLALLRSAGFERLNLDLIFGVPGQTLDAWLRSLYCALEFKTGHLSCYGLTYEPNTPLAVRKRLGQIKAIDSELELEMLRATRRVLAEAGLPPYEISNYSRPGMECRHNLAYWNGADYIALGPSAASHIHGTRWRNRPHLGEWETAIDQGEFPAIDVELLSPEQRAGELAMLMLRLSSGIVLADFEARIGRTARSCFADTIDRLAALGLLELSPGAIRLSERGLPVADSIAGEFVA